MLDKSILLENEKHEDCPLLLENTLDYAERSEEQSELTIERQRNDVLEKELKLITKTVKKLKLELTSKKQYINSLDSEVSDLQKRCSVLSDQLKIKKIEFSSANRIKIRQEKELLELKEIISQQNDCISSKIEEIGNMLNEQIALKKALSILPDWNTDQIKDPNALFEEYRKLICEIKKSAPDYKNCEKLLAEIDEKQIAIEIERETIEKTNQKIEKDKEEITYINNNIKSIYANYEYWIRNRDTIKEKAAKLKYLENDITKQLGDKENEIDAFLEKSEELNLLKEQFRQKEKHFEREQRWFKQERAQLRKQEEQMYKYSVNVQSKLYKAIEKDEQVLFIIRSLEAVAPIYEQVITNLVSCLKNERIQYIVFSYMLGKSFYEIAQEVGIPAVNVKRSYMLAINKISKHQSK